MMDLCAAIKNDVKKLTQGRVHLVIISWWGEQAEKLFPQFS